MQLYLDTSAIVKLIVLERESAPLTEYLSDFPDDVRFTSALTRTELIRAVSRSGSLDMVAHARRVLGRLDTVSLTHRLLDEAGGMNPVHLRTLDAIHLAAAATAPELRALVTYDDRLAEAAKRSGMAVAAPGQDRV